MCTGAMFHARLTRVVYGAADYKTGVAESVMNVYAHEQLNHHINYPVDVVGGVLADEESGRCYNNFSKNAGR